MRFPPSFLDDIKARLPVSEVVRRRVKLQKSGREWKGLSPFGTEKTPSFFVNDQKMAWFDFSSGKNGNIFDFVMETEGLSFPESVERLAGDAGLALPARSIETERQEQRRAGLHEVLEWAAAFFEVQLRGERGREARTYLDGRDIKPASREAFRIGYAPPDRHALRDALAAKGASVDTMCEAGLLIHGEDIAVPYDKFRHRVMFPIADRGGRVIAFGGRALEKDVAAKYLNSPETPVFHKGRLLYNHHRARKAAHDSGRVIAVEGYVDVIAMQAAGFPETVAGLGTALTEDQAGLLWQMAPQPILCFDGDKAGRKAAFRAIDMALPLIGPNRTLAFALLPEGQDPDDLIREAGASAMQVALEAALPLVDLIWLRETEDRPLATPEQRASLERDLAELAKQIRDEPLRRHYRADFDQRLKALFGTTARQDGWRSERGQPHERRSGQAGQPRRGTFRGGPLAQEKLGYLMAAPVRASSSLEKSFAFRPPNRTSIHPWESMVIVLLLSQPHLIIENVEALANLEFEGLGLSKMRSAMLDYAQDGVGAGAGLRGELAEAGFKSHLDAIDRSGAGVSWYSRPETSFADASIMLKQALSMHHKERLLPREINSAAGDLAIDMSEANFARLRDLHEQRNAKDGMEASIEGFGLSSKRLKSSI